MKVLVIDASSDQCLALVSDKDRQWSRVRLAPRQQSVLLLSFIEEVLSEAGMQLADLEALAFVAGPGSFTGLRLSAALTQGLALSHNLPVIQISTLQAMAQTLYHRKAYTRVLAMMDARRGNYYWGDYSLGDDGMMYGFDQMTEITQIESTSQAIASLSRLTDNVALQQLLADANDYDECYPSTEALCTIVQNKAHAKAWVSVDLALPFYLQQQAYTTKESSWINNC